MDWIEGLKDYKQSIADFRSALPDCQFTVHVTIVEGNAVAARLTCRGTHIGECRDSTVPPTGKEVTAPGCIVYHCVDGKVVEEWDYCDELGFWQQLGHELLLPQGQGEE